MNHPGKPHPKEFPLCLFTQHAIHSRIAHLGKEIAADWPADAPMDLVVVLEGGFFFAAELIRAIQVAAPIEIYVHTVKCSVYPPPAPEMEDARVLGLPPHLSGMNPRILLVDCLMDTGYTMHLVVKHMLDVFNPGMIESCVLLKKSKTHEAHISAPRYVGFQIPDRVVVGYGLDSCTCAYRDLQGIWATERLPGEPVTDIITVPDDAEMPKGLPPLDRPDPTPTAEPPKPRPLPPFDASTERTAGPPDGPEPGPTEPGPEPAEPGPEPTEASEEADTPPTNA